MPWSLFPHAINGLSLSDSKSFKFSQKVTSYSRRKETGISCSVEGVLYSFTLGLVWFEYVLPLKMIPTFLVPIYKALLTIHILQH